MALYSAFLRRSGTLALQWLDYRRLAWAHPGDITLFLIALGFLALGIFVGTRAMAAPAPVPFDGNPKAQASLGISPRELTHPAGVGRRPLNKEIATNLDDLAQHGEDHVSPGCSKSWGQAAYGRHRSRAANSEYDTLRERNCGVNSPPITLLSGCFARPEAALIASATTEGKYQMFRKILGYGIGRRPHCAGVPLSILTVSVDTGHGIWGMVIELHDNMLIHAQHRLRSRIRRRRDIDLGGVIGFWPALGMGLGISIIASIIYVIAWETTVDIRPYRLRQRRLPQA